ncbi:eukaryotic translation initiation factor 1A X-linked b, partial [Clupea harengus]|uniref:Eukaryotic translation initiation factor 1A X-linked b n=1 Tax=Clupea harengus TaxID=7950 RepID=A0A8M1KJ99_CLUHA
SWKFINRTIFTCRHICLCGLWIICQLIVGYQSCCLQQHHLRSLNILCIYLQVWINTSDIILVGLRDYQDNKADVILKYNADEARSLKAYGELPEHAKINETDTFGPGDDDEIMFDDIGDDDEDIDDI